jgi:hypothetical protein
MQPSSSAPARLALLAVASLALPAEAASAKPHEWNFSVLLDGAPIGTHRFVVADEGADKTVRSDADFTVRMLGIAVYRYRHEARERWRGGCLAQLTAATDDDGKQSSVRGDQQGDVFGTAVSPAASGAETSARGCLMSYAYWNPALRRQSRLVNPQTGRIDPVTVTPIAAQTLDVHGAPTQAQGIRIGGPADTIDVWYTPQGDWIGLDSTVADGKKLSYRLP